VYASSSLSVEQRREALVLFGQGYGSVVTARILGAAKKPIDHLYDRWQVHGEAAIVARTTNRSFSGEFKLSVVKRFLAGETAMDLVREFGLSSPKLVGSWVRIYRREGPEALFPKPIGRPKRVDDSKLSELERLQRENELLRAKVAYLGKLRALRAEELGKNHKP